MTDVVLNKKILGHRAGTILPYTKALEGHVRAGNATVLPAETEGEHSAPHPSQYDRRPSPLVLAPEPQGDEPGNSGEAHDHARGADEVDEDTEGEAD